MVITSLYLTPDQLKALRLMAEEKNNSVIRRECNIRSLPEYNVILKRKTGIHNLKDSQEVQQYLSNIEKAAQSAPSEEQLSLLRRMLGISHSQHTILSLANNLGITQEEAEEQYTAALAALGIFATHASTRIVQARLWMAAQEPFCQPTMPLTPKQWNALRLYAQGGSNWAIMELMGYQKECYARLLVKEMCAKLSITARGRGVQRKLAAVAIAKKDQELLADPLF